MLARTVAIDKFVVTKNRASDIIAIASLVLFTSSQLLFRYSTLATTYSIIGELFLRDGCAMAATAIAIAAIATKPYSMKMWQSTLAVASLIVLTYSGYRTGDYRLAQGYVILIAIAGIDLDVLCKTYYMTVAPIIVLVIGLSIANMEYNKDVIPNARLVFAYGFGHPNTTGCVLFSAIGAMSFSHWNKKTWKVPFILSILAAFFSCIALSSNASSALLIILAVVNFFSHISKITRTIAIPKRAYIALIAIISFCGLTIMLICTAFYDSNNPLFEWFNSLIHGRPYYSHEYYLAYGGFTHLGRAYTSVPHDHNGLPFSGIDSGYSYLALVYGLFSMYVLLITYFIAIWRTSNERNNLILLVVFLMCALYMLVEGFPLFITTCFATLFISRAFDSMEETSMNDAYR